MKREFALDYAAGRLDDKSDLAQITVLRDEATVIDSGDCSATGIAPDKVTLGRGRPPTGRKRSSTSGTPRPLGEGQATNEGGHPLGPERSSRRTRGR
jgi:hypothetical protein